MSDVCSKNKSSPNVCAVCNPDSYDRSCFGACNAGRRDGTRLGYTPLPLPSKQGVLSGLTVSDRQCPPSRRDVSASYNDPNEQSCIDGIRNTSKLSCDAVIYLCNNAGADTLLHEMAHVVGIAGQTGARIAYRCISRH